MASRVFIIGGGIISAPGENLNELYHQLKTGISSLRKLTLFESSISQNLLVGEVSKTNEELKKELELPNNKIYSRTFLLGLWAVKQAIDNSKLKSTDLKNASFISSNTVGGMDITEEYALHYFKKNEASKLAKLKQHECGASTELITKTLGIQGFYTTINTACSSSANAIMLGARMIESGSTDIVIAGGTDALCNFTINGFQSLLLLSPEISKPFDDDRCGLNLGEGAAYIILCSESKIKEYDPIAELIGWGNANDAFHQTASSPDGKGATLAMQEAIKISKLNCEEIDYINAHGTATQNNDLAEANAIKNVFNKIPDFSSTKPFTGHTLGASGAIEAIISILSLREDIIFPNLNFSKPIYNTDMIPITSLKKKTINTILSNSFGFGGNCTSLLFKKI
jgi:3-oxoacyl-(acyl-carrier-protein) synthase